MSDLSDSGRQIGDCSHGHSRAFCATCLREENARLRTENAAYWRAVVALEEWWVNSEDSDPAACVEAMVAIRRGNSYAHVPEPVVKLSLEREEKLAQRVQALEAALRPFARMWDYCEEELQSDDALQVNSYDYRSAVFGDCRRAAKLLED